MLARAMPLLRLQKSRLLQPQTKPRSEEAPQATFSNE
jgi:hypothetical protein